MAKSRSASRSKNSSGAGKQVALRSEKTSEVNKQAAPRLVHAPIRNFDAGKMQRRLRSVPSATQAINSQIRFYGQTVIARSRYLTQNNPYAASAKEAFIAALVGDGIKPSSLLSDEPDLREAIQEAFLLWTDEADADWLTDFYGLQALIAAEMFEAGECFVRIRSRRPEDGLLVPMQLQLIPAEMLPHTDNRPTSGTGSARVEMGIEFDAIGRRTAYHFLREHPGNPGSGIFPSSTTTRVPAEEVLHLFRPSVAGQIRGVPHMVSTIAKLAIMDQYDDAELERKRVAALFGGFITRAPDLDDETDPALGGILSDAPMEDRGFEPGAFAPLNAGEDVRFSEPADVGGNYDIFQYRSLTAISAGMGVPYHAMTGDVREANYSSLRASLVEFKRRIRAMQNHVMIYQFCRPVWQRWFIDAAMAGAFPINLARLQGGVERRRVMAAKWIEPKWDWVDPLKDIQAEQMAVESGFKSRSDVVEAMGYDPEEVDQRIAADQERAQALRITLGEAAFEPAAQEIDDGE